MRIFKDISKTQPVSLAGLLNEFGCFQFSQLNLKGNCKISITSPLCIFGAWLISIL